MGVNTVVEAARNAGFSGDDLVTAVAVALAESSGRPRATNENTNGSKDYGLWQINTVHQGAGFNPNKAFDPEYNAKWAHRLFQESGWKPWVAYNTGSYEKFLDDARAAVRGAGGGGGGRVQAAGGGFTPVDEDDDDQSDLLVNVLQSISTHMRGTADPDETPEEKAVRVATGGFGEGPGEQLNAAGEPMSTKVGADLDYTSEEYNTGSLAWGGYSNGKIPKSALKKLNVGGITHWFKPDVAASTRQMIADAKRDGVRILFTDSYRSYADQVDVKNRKGDLAATPGKSVHGWGRAVDVNGEEAQAWMRRNGAKYGWIHPEWAKPGGSNPEAWHFEHRGVVSSSTGGRAI